jgi:AcrR family transcriptional regulator
MVERTMAAWTKEIQGREEQYELKRLALLRTAARAFIEDGYYETTLDDIAGRLGVTKPTLYYYIKNKEDILYQCMRLALEEGQEALDVAKSHGTTGLERLHAFLARFAEIIATDFGTCLILSRDDALSPEARQTIRDSRATMDKQVRQIIEVGIADGSIAQCDPKLTAFTLFGALNWMAHWYRDTGQYTPREVAEHALQVFEKGLTPRTG